MKPRFDFFKSIREDESNEVYLDLIIRREYSRPEKPVVRVWMGKQSRPYQSYYYKDIPQAEKYITEYKEQAKRRHEDKQKIANAKKEALANFELSFKAGDIFYTSWGYDQTNVNYYKVLEAKGRTVLLQEVNACVEETGFMQGKCVPNVNSKRGEPFRRRVGINTHRGNNTQYVKISECQRGYLWDGSPNFCSWYA